MKAQVAATTAVFFAGQRLLLKNLDRNAFIGSYLLGLLALRAFGPAGFLVVCLYLQHPQATSKESKKARARYV